MAKATYPSRYSPAKLVSAPQYIVEFVCEKKAKKEGKDLPTQFWQLPEWNKFYRSQIHTANSLVKKHGAEAVIAALKNPKGFWMYSLRAPGFEGMILEERRNAILKEKMREAEGKTSDIPNVDINAKPQERRKKTLGDLLDEGK
jgi:hypothetical protein